MVKPSVFVRSGSLAELSCTYDTHATEGFTLEWRYSAPGMPAVQAKRVLYYNGRLYWVNSWEGRMTLVQNPPVKGVASVKIINAQSSDAGLYICEVTNPSDWSGSGQGLINLTVLVPPSKPVCQLQGNTYMGNDVTLSCQSSQGLPTPIYSWHREQNAAPLLPDSCIEDQRTGSLMLHNLSDAFTGTYTCRSSNELGQSACSIILRVAHGETAAVIGALVMGIFLVLLLIGAAVAYVICNRKKQLKKTYSSELSQVNNNSIPHQQTEGNQPTGQSVTEEQMDLKVSHFSPLV
ncbi:V-set and immunoglobulin domain-containing protein 2-like [Myxocyprinus asiaticus]|uniref:V-set and immunoglobulin domain-containing protein 2-like n=1 Tax=Myxocyprinus asiaticus TaxID=70543 RepID=UPI00222191F3|nr:V-set and immunoglobulin domain-containing protein 2-like [Myxocyprinus asiaticus]